MSRFQYDEGESDYPELHQGRWETNVRRTLLGKRGQAFLRDLEQALLVLPEPRLISGWLATPQGDCCALGALAAYHAQKQHPLLQCLGMRAAVQSVAVGLGPASWSAYSQQALEAGHDDDDPGYSIDAGEALGLSRTMAERIGLLNDDDLAHLDPEGRWKQVLAWVRRWIAKGEAAR